MCKRPEKLPLGVTVKEKEPELPGRTASAWKNKPLYEPCANVKGSGMKLAVMTVLLRKVNCNAREFVLTESLKPMVDQPSNTQPLSAVAVKVWVLPRTTSLDFRPGEMLPSPLMEMFSRLKALPPPGRGDETRKDWAVVSSP